MQVLAINYVAENLEVEKFYLLTFLHEKLKTGLGRTGVLLCCYLIYTQRLQTVEAIRYVRRKRPNAVQTSGQITVLDSNSIST